MADTRRKNEKEYEGKTNSWPIEEWPALMKLAKRYHELYPEAVEWAERMFIPKQKGSRDVDWYEEKAEMANESVGRARMDTEGTHRNMTFDNILEGANTRDYTRQLADFMRHDREIQEATMLLAGYTPEEIAEMSPGEEFISPGIRTDIDRALALETMLKEWKTELPKKLYRGEYWSNDKNTDDTYPYLSMASGNKDIRSPTGELTFVSTEPSVAASYHRHEPFERDFAKRPSNFGDYVWEIDTYGLNPELFIRDYTSTAGEAKFGPQYMYLDRIMNDDVPIILENGSTLMDKEGKPAMRKRIRKIPYNSDIRTKTIEKLSDGNCKDVYYPKHLLRGILQRF